MSNDVENSARKRKEQTKDTTNIGDVIRKAMKIRGYTHTMLADELGYSGQNAISMMLSGRKIRLDTALAALDKLGFDIIVKDRNGSNRENAWKIESKSGECEQQAEE